MMRKLVSYACSATLALAEFASPGLAADKRPEETVKELLADCSTYYDQDAQTLKQNSRNTKEWQTANQRNEGCGNPILGATFGNTDFCMPPSVMGDFEADRLASVQWLSGHPEMAELTALDGLHTAFKALYPCH